MTKSSSLSNIYDLGFGYLQRHQHKLMMEQQVKKTDISPCKEKNQQFISNRFNDILLANTPKKLQKNIQTPVKLSTNQKNCKRTHQNLLRISNKVNQINSSVKKINHIQVNSNDNKHLEVRKKLNEFLQNKVENRIQTNSVNLTNITNSYINNLDKYHINLSCILESNQEALVNSKFEVSSLKKCNEKEKENLIFSDDKTSYRDSDQIKIGRQSSQQNEKSSFSLRKMHHNLDSCNKIENKATEKNIFMPVKGDWNPKEFDSIQVKEPLQYNNSFIDNEILLL